MGRRIKYESGMRFCSFVIVNPGPVRRSANNRTYTTWECICDCGKKFLSTTKQIRRGVRRSCGCLSKSNRFKNIEPRKLAINHRHNHYIQSAKNRGYKWALSKEEFEDLIFDSCHYCGSPPILKFHAKGQTGEIDIFINGIDRKNNRIGYIKENCVTCCHFCNRAKSHYPFKEFVSWIKRMKNADYCRQ